MTRAEIVDLIARRDAAWNRRDVGAMTAFHAEDGAVESLMAGHVEGRGAIRDVYRAFFTAFPDFTLHTDHLIVEGDRAVQVASAGGTDTGGFMGVPATRKSFRMPVVFLYTFHDGEIAYERRLYDFTGLLVQIGILKTKPA
jgi:steroid delta-isomerase-like uncharacterized protein